MPGKRKAAFALKPGAGLCPAYPAEPSAASAEVHVWNPRQPHSPGSGQGTRETKELSKSRKFIKKRFPSGQETAWSSSHGARGSFTAAACLLCRQYFTWLLWKHNEMVISKITSHVQALSCQRKGSKTTFLCSRSAWLLKVGLSCSGSLPEPSPEDQAPTNSPSHFSFWYFITVCLQRSYDLPPKLQLSRRNFHPCH